MLYYISFAWLHFLNFTKKQLKRKNDKLEETLIKQELSRTNSLSPQNDQMRLNSTIINQNSVELTSVREETNVILKIIFSYL